MSIESIQSSMRVFGESLTEASERLSIIANEDWIEEQIEKNGIEKLSTLKGFQELVNSHQMKENGLFNKLYADQSIKNVAVSKVMKDYKDLIKTLYHDYDFVLSQLTKILVKVEQGLAKKEAEAVIELTYRVATSQKFNLEKDFPLFPSKGEAMDWISLVIGLHYFRNSYDCGEMYEVARKKIFDLYK